MFTKLKKTFSNILDGGSSINYASKVDKDEISPEFLKQMKAIQIRTNYLVNDIMAGEYETAFKGRGMEFAEVREYQPGDDIRAIDWNVTARMDAVYIKEYKEERELTVMILVDVSSSGQFGSHGKLKNEVAAEVASILAFMAVKNNDKVGLIVFSDTIESYIPPKKGKGHVWQVIKAILSVAKEMKRDAPVRLTDIKAPLEFLMNVQKRKSVCFVISDFLDDGFKKSLQIAKQRHDIIAVTITDPREKDMPNVGFVELEDAETGRTILINTSDNNAMKKYNLLTESDSESLRKLFRSIKIELIEVRTDQPYTHPIMNFFKRREKRMV